MAPLWAVPVFLRKNLNIEINIAVISLLLFALFSNIPLGYLRMGSPRYSLRWFVFIHLSVPFIIGLRVANNVSWHIIPVSIAFAVAGQMIGSRIYRRSRS
jgi:hypothetical protein